ncbi:squalene monooxygenase [Parastagonospora nodorum]|uniref:Squalene monooxygenase n=1 Tax=Phaeosphaeria nodorum (strain SN15 / ATCC MYA-4574 / FGSC 10173) TaxID=321614 RepID=A0A7U2FJ17_PHANO|nr:squalene monooxygenase [Parastagonospora nodorum]QRD04195.1 squalene monooxygenase [Parastagonospora nodorum SN15]KAH3926133.1 squalene monooxygenase [Parastagonospora nodorum]KAH3944715.1 squalene monooxygenase [Parastagonospora nodorum]KAH3960628.1 squalene monooxygenase [Parastagonospora nodorum]
MLTMFSGSKIAEMPPTSSQLRPPHLRNRGTSTSSVPTTNSGTINTADAQERRRLEHHEADVVIVGAGIVGCAAAVAFGKQGRSVLLLEKSLKEPDRIVGELLQPGGVNALEKLGMKDCLDDIDAIPCYGYQVSYHREPVRIAYPNNLVESDPSKPPEGRSFHHGRFISKLRAKARATPNVTVVETTVTDIVKSEYNNQVLGVESQTAGNKDYYFGAVTLVADGYASKFRKEYIAQQPEVRSKFWGLELIDAELPMPNHGHVILTDAPPILIYQIGTHETRILVDIPDGLPSASVKAGGVKNHMLNVALPNLPECVQPSFRRAIEAGKLRSMPNSFLPPQTQKTPGLIILGDAMNMRHPLTGGGMTVGFNDVVTLSTLLSPANVPSLEDTSAVLSAMSQFHWARKSGSSVINILAMALYSLFAANTPQVEALKNGCFRYFQLGGKHISEPAGLLSGLIKNPLVLVYHFFSVAFYAVWCRLKEESVWKAPYVLTVESAMIVWTAACVIGPYLVWEVRR